MSIDEGVAVAKTAGQLVARSAGCSQHLYALGLCHRQPPRARGSHALITVGPAAAALSN